MAVIIVIVGLVILGVGTLVLIAPVGLKKVLRIFLAKQCWYFIAATRILVGTLFVLAASETGAPWFVRIMGILFILSGLVIPLMGAPRIERLVSWWLERSDTTLRLWGLVAAAFGGAILWSGFKG